jgi:hypothetical protein
MTRVNASRTRRFDVDQQREPKQGLESSLGSRRATLGIHRERFVKSLASYADIFLRNTLTQAFVGSDRS